MEIINVGMLYLSSKYIVRVTIAKSYERYYSQEHTYTFISDCVFQWVYLSNGEKKQSIKGLKILLAPSL